MSVARLKSSASICRAASRRPFLFALGRTSRLATVASPCFSQAKFGPRPALAFRATRAFSVSPFIRSNSSAAAAAAEAKPEQNEAPPMAYAELKGRLEPSLMSALDHMGYKTMTPVQQQILTQPSYTSDFLVQAKTGTGKTTAFLLPVLQNLLTAPRPLPRSQVGALIMAPTRELAQQIGAECDQLTAQCDPRLECHLAYGQSNRNVFLKRFMDGNPSILVATPGRLKDYLQDPDPAVRARFKDLRTLVLDEADTMLEAGFLRDLLAILELLPAKKAAGWQGLAFSATLSPKVDKVLHHVLLPDATHISTLSKDDTPTVDAIPQFVRAVPGIEQQLPALHTLLATELLDKPDLKAIVFCQTARAAGLLYSVFSQDGALPGRPQVLQVHSRMSQKQRERAVAAFKEARSGILFASDVVGRGLDFPDIGLVVQVGPPDKTDQYVHRVGRTGRAGNKDGRAVILLLPEEMDFLRKNKKFPIQDGNAPHPRSTEVDSAAALARALPLVPAELKEKAYIGFIGFLSNNMRGEVGGTEGVVALANRYAAALGCEPTPPALEFRVIGKMGLKGAPGLRIKRSEESAPRRTTSAREGYDAYANAEDSRSARPREETAPWAAGRSTKVAYDAFSRGEEGRGAWTRGEMAPRSEGRGDYGAAQSQSRTYGGRRDGGRPFTPRRSSSRY